MATPKGQRTKNRFRKRCAWGSIRSRVRQRFSRGDYEVERDWLRPERTAFDTFDLSRIRWRLKNRRSRGMGWSAEDKLTWLGGLHGDTLDIERTLGLFVPRYDCCGSKMVWGRIWMPPWTDANVCMDCAHLYELPGVYDTEWDRDPPGRWRLIRGDLFRRRSVPSASSGEGAEAVEGCRSRP